MKHLAIDIGAESGRAVVGELEKGRLEVREINRFANMPVRMGETLRWNDRQIVEDVRNSVKLGDSEGVGSVGIDTWAIDFALLDIDGRITQPPYHYRDSQTEGIMEEVFGIVPKEQIYAATGIQFLRFNTLYQLYAMAKRHDPGLERAIRFLTVPDYLNYVLTETPVGRTVCEYTNATTTQFFNPVTGRWAKPLLNKLDMKFVAALLPDVVRPGSVLGPIPGSNIQVIAPACHDTGSAVVAVPMEDENCAWISSGTWSIMGVEISSPNLSEGACEAGFTNEGGAENTIRFGKNVMGLWIVQECKRSWELQGQRFTYANLNELAQEVNARGAYIDPDEDVLLAPGIDMPNRVNRLLAAGGFQPVETPGEIIRVVLESLARKYAIVLEQLRRLTGRPIARIHVVGGGSQNHLLNQLTAEACGVPVIAGPVEATAIGNLIVQMMATGELENLAAGRKLVRESFEMREF